MEETIVLDQVKYDLYRRIYVALIAAGHEVPARTAAILTGQAYEALTQAEVIANTPIGEPE